MDCPVCGGLIEEEQTRFCPHCGTLLAEQPSQVRSDQTRPSTSLHGVPARIWAEAQAAEHPRWGNNYGQPSPAPDHPPTRSSLYLADPPPHPSVATPRPPSLPRIRHTGRVLVTLALVVIVAAAAGVAGYAFGRQSTTTAGIPSNKTTAPRTPTTAGETVVFRDPLTRAAHPWPQDSQCLFQDGSYHIMQDAPCFAPVGVLGDANISVQVKQLSGTVETFFGIIFRYVDAQDFYDVRLNSNSLWLVEKYSHGAHTELIPDSSNAAIKPGIGVVNTVLVRAHGAHLQFFVNGVELGQLTDSTFASGAIGLRGPSVAADTAWNNFQITSSTS